jgi:hypothetical protein
MTERHIVLRPSPDGFILTDRYGRHLLGFGGVHAELVRQHQEARAANEQLILDDGELML